MTETLDTQTNFDIPILFLIFNRLDTTKQVFDIIRKTSPTTLYIASDGPRDNRESEKEKVETVRNYVLESIDWDCEVKTLFRENNLGCGRAVSESITWFFNNVEMGIILEDDCLPSMSFFPYCKELLEKYKDNEQIYHIAGNNPLTVTEIPYSYYFARIQHCWGWASWRRAWNYYNFNIINLNNFITQNKINKIFTRNIDRKYWLDIFKMMENYKGYDIWDYQWTYYILYNDGLCINPGKNLITNIGFGSDATHTISNDSTFNNQSRFEINKIIHAENIEVNMRLVNNVNTISFGISSFSYYKKILKSILTKLHLHKFISLYRFITIKKQSEKHNKNTCI
jgi:hypothetical protein